MPILDPRKVQQVLRKNGLRPEKDKTELQAILEAESLTVEDVISELGSLVRGAEWPIKLRGIETVLKLQGLLNNNDVPVQIPTVTINIQGSYETNPILIPRSIINHERSSEGNSDSSPQ